MRRKLGHPLVSIAALLMMLFVLFGLPLVPTPAKQSGHWCPSLVEVAVLGDNPSARLKTEFGMPLGSFYYACTRNGPVTAWALFWLAMVAVSILLVVVTLGSRGQERVTAAVPQPDRRGPNPHPAPDRMTLATETPSDTQTTPGST